MSHVFLGYLLGGLVPTPLQHLTVADLSKTWISEHLVNAVTKYIRQWLELPISATLSAIILTQ